MRSEADALTVHRGDQFAVDRRGTRAAEGVIRSNGQQERPAAVLDMDNELRRSALDGVGNLDVGLSAVQRYEAVIERELHAGGGGVVSGNAKAIDGGHGSARADHFIRHFIHEPFFFYRCGRWWRRLRREQAKGAPVELGT